MAVKLCTGLWYHNIELMHEQVGNDKEGKGRGVAKKQGCLPLGARSVVWCAGSILRVRSNCLHARRTVNSV